MVWVLSFSWFLVWMIWSWKISEEFQRDLHTCRNIKTCDWRWRSTWEEKEHNQKSSLSLVCFCVFAADGDFGEFAGKTEKQKPNRKPSRKSQIHRGNKSFKVFHLHGHFTARNLDDEKKSTLLNIYFSLFRWLNSSHLLWSSSWIWFPSKHKSPHWCLFYQNQLFTCLWTCSKICWSQKWVYHISCMCLTFFGHAAVLASYWLKAFWSLFIGLLFPFRPKFFFCR